MKIVTNNNFNPDQEKIMKNEIEIHRDLDHPNILKMYDFFNNEERLVIITEIISGGNVF
jgi:calcium-dependent protein kinase